MAKAIRLSFALLLLAGAALLILRPDPRNDLRAANEHFVAGRYYDALQAYKQLSLTLPAAQMRLGMVRAIRGEGEAAERALRAAMQRGLSSVDYHLVLLYLGQVLADRGRDALARQTWDLIDDCRSPEACALRGPARVLGGDLALRRGEYDSARASYTDAQSELLPVGWADLVLYRLALLRAEREPDPALESLTAPVAIPTSVDNPLLTPLLPSSTARDTAQLVAVLQAAPDERPQLLGQLYLSLGLYGLAERQFAQIDPNGPDAQAAAAYAAYTRYRAGDYAGGLMQLEQLVTRNPDDPRARTLLALAYLATEDSDAAREQIDTVAQLSPVDPNLHLAWASWYTARREYAEASLEYGQALAQAAPAERGSYALLGANFHLTTTFELCESGLPLAELAATTLPDNAGAWSTLAASRYHCAQFPAAVEAARRAEGLGAGAEATYYHGAALAALGNADQARSELIRTADLAPASIWRERAESTLAMLP